MEDYLEYQRYICTIPEFLNKYLELDILKRLKDISVLCGMDYASKHIYDFKFYMSRFNHSLNVALITWRLTYDKTQTLAALFHDISTPVFSHVIDYMNGDYIKQESTEHKTEDVLRSSKQLLEYLREDMIDINDIVDFKKYSIVDLPRPSLCADRFDNLIGVGMCWSKKVGISLAKNLVDTLYVDKNEDGKLEISLFSEYLARCLTYINYDINRLTHSNEDTYMMSLLANIVKLLIDKKIITYDSLYILNEPEMLKIIEDYLNIDELYEMYNKWKNIETVDEEMNIEVKELTLRPIVCGRRVNNL